jgi:hypothetical protein
MPCDHVARLIVNANHSVMRTAVKLRVADCVADCVWVAVLPAIKWQHVGNQIKAALVAARGALRKVLASGLDERDYFDCSSRSPR